MRLPADKLSRLKDRLAKWSLRKSCRRLQLESLIGSLQHACSVVQPGRAFLRWAIDLLRTLGPQSYDKCLLWPAKSQCQSASTFHARVHLVWGDVAISEDNQAMCLFLKCNSQHSSRSLRVQTPTLRSGVCPLNLPECDGKSSAGDQRCLHLYRRHPRHVGTIEEEHLRNLAQVLQRLWLAGMRLKKCAFLSCVSRSHHQSRRSPHGGN